MLPKSKTIRSLAFLSFIILWSCCNKTDPTLSRDFGQIQPVPFHGVVLNDNFWRPRMSTQEDVLIPFAFEKVKPAIDALRMTADFVAGKETDLPNPHRYQSSDLYKVMEGAAYILQQNPANLELERKMDSIIAIISDAQETKSDVATVFWDIIRAKEIVPQAQ